MQLEVHIQAIREDLANTAGLGDEATAEAAQRLSEALGSTLHLRLLDLLGEAALEIGRPAGSGRVEVRLAGRDPELVVVMDEAADARPARPRGGVLGPYHAPPPRDARRRASKRPPPRKASRPTPGSSARSRACSSRARSKRSRQPPPGLRPGLKGEHGSCFSHHSRSSTSHTSTPSIPATGSAGAVPARPGHAAAACPERSRTKRQPCRSSRPQAPSPSRSEFRADASSSGRPTSRVPRSSSSRSAAAARTPSSRSRSHTTSARAVTSSRSSSATGFRWGPIQITWGGDVEVRVTCPPGTDLELSGASTDLRVDGDVGEVSAPHGLRRHQAR